MYGNEQWLPQSSGTSLATFKINIKKEWKLRLFKIRTVYKKY